MIYLLFVVLQISLREGCRKILVSDYYHLIQKLVGVQKKGIYVDGKIAFISFLFTDFQGIWAVKLRPNEVFHYLTGSAG